MKEVLAIIRMDKMNETRRLLSDAGLSCLTARKVMGRGKGLVDLAILKGAEEGQEEAISQLGQGPRLIPKRALTLVLPDDKVEAAVTAIIAANKAGRPGDGKVFVLPILDAIRIRTGETGDQAVDEVTEE